MGSLKAEVKANESFFHIVEIDRPAVALALMRPQAAVEWIDGTVDGFGHKGEAVVIRLVVCAAIFSMLAACATERQTTRRLFDGRLEIALPESYEPSDTRLEEPLEVFFKYGGTDALARKFPDYPNRTEVLHGPLGENVQAYIEITLANVTPTDDSSLWWNWKDAVYVPPAATATQLHQHVCKGFSSSWGEYTFQHFDQVTGLGHCVNFAGAFVALSSRRIDDTLVLVGSMDYVELLLVEYKGPGKAILNMTDEEKWEVFEKAAAADVAERALLGARLR